MLELGDHLASNADTFAHIAVGANAFQPLVRAPSVVAKFGSSSRSFEIVDFAENNGKQMDDIFFAEIACVGGEVRVVDQRVCVDDKADWMVVGRQKIRQGAQVGQGRPHLLQCFLDRSGDRAVPAAGEAVHEPGPRQSRRATVEGLSDMAVLNQGLIDRRERSAAVQALAYLRAHGVPLDPDGLMVEALRNGWGSTGPEDLRQIAIDLNKGKKLQFTTRTRPERLEEWAHAR